MCLYSKLIKNRKYTLNKKNGGNIPPVSDDRTLYVPVGCGNCIECRKKKAREWQVRLLEDIKDNKNGKFITLTFSNESIKELLKYEKTCTDIVTGKKYKITLNSLSGYELDNQIAKVAVRLFLERWRKKYKKSIRHWLITELGHNGTENIHLHGIIWTDEPLEEVERIWSYGHVWKGKMVKDRIVNYVNAKTVNYIIKYVTKVDEIHKTYKGVILCSSGIGKNYTNKHDFNKNKYIEGKTNETYKTSTGHKISIPIYWRNKLYTEEEREKLWLEKLNKEERWVMGEKVKVNTEQGQKEYENLVNYYRRKNIELGYNDDTKDEERIIYERERRNIMLKTRLAKIEAKKAISLT